MATTAIYFDVGPVLVSNPILSPMNLSHLRLVPPIHLTLLIPLVQVVILQQQMNIRPCLLVMLLASQQFGYDSLSLSLSFLLMIICFSIYISFRILEN